MFFEPPKNKNPEELYRWAMELIEKLNRELNTEKENGNGV